MTRITLFPIRELGAWSRIYRRAILSHSMTKDAEATALRNAYIDMRDEQAAEGKAAGIVQCGFCWREATHQWIRTPEDLKALRPKYRGKSVPADPVSIRCERHVLNAVASKYRPFGRRLAQLAAA